MKFLILISYYIICRFKYNTELIFLLIHLTMETKKIFSKHVSRVDIHSTNANSNLHCLTFNDLKNH